MSFECTATEIKKMVEADEFFKPASKAQLSLRKDPSREALFREMLDRCISPAYAKMRHAIEQLSYYLSYAAGDRVKVVETLANMWIISAELNVLEGQRYGGDMRSGGYGYWNDAMQEIDRSCVLSNDEFNAIDKLVRQKQGRVTEAEQFFKPATDFHIAARKEQEAAREQERIAAMGPKFQQLKALVVEIRELEKDYIYLTEHTFNAHGNHSQSRNYYGPGSNVISYNIKVRPWNKTPLSDICQKHGLEEQLWEYEADQYRDTLEGFVGEERRYTRKGTESFKTGGGLVVDYPDLFDDWEQDGSNGGYLTLILSDIGWEDMDHIYDRVNPNGIAGEYDDSRELDDDYDYAVDYKAKLTKRIQDINAVEQDVRRTVASCKKYMESIEFGNDFFQNREYREDDEEYMEAAREWDVYVASQKKGKKVKESVNEDKPFFKPASPAELSNRPEPEEDDEYGYRGGSPEDGDIIISSNGFRETVGIVNGTPQERQLTRTFSDSEKAADYARKLRHSQGDFFPNMWYQDDHGGCSLFESKINEDEPFFKPATPEMVADRKGFKVTKVREPGGDYNLVTISGFYLPLGNNYRTEHLAIALINDAPEVRDEIGRLDNNDEVKLIYRGKYGNHEDTFAVCDLWDYFRNLE